MFLYYLSAEISSFYIYLDKGNKSIKSSTEKKSTTEFKSKSQCSFKSDAIISQNLWALTRLRSIYGKTSEPTWEENILVMTSKTREHPVITKPSRLKHLVTEIWQSCSTEVADSYIPEYF